MDLIYRQQAIDALKRNTFRLTFAEEQNCEGHVAWSAEAVYSEVMEGALLELPAAQTCEDAVSRQAAIDEAEEWIEAAYCEEGDQRERDAIRHVIHDVKRLPSVQPEIIACGDCIHWICHDRRCGYWNHGVKPIDFCSKAERREHGSD